MTREYHQKLTKAQRDHLLGGTEQAEKLYNMFTSDANMSNAQAHHLLVYCALYNLNPELAEYISYKFFSERDQVLQLSELGQQKAAFLVDKDYEGAASRQSEMEKIQRQLDRHSRQSLQKILRETIEDIRHVPEVPYASKDAETRS